MTTPDPQDAMMLFESWVLSDVYFVREAPIQRTPPLLNSSASNSAERVRTRFLIWCGPTSSRRVKYEDGENIDA